MKQLIIAVLVAFLAGAGAGYGYGFKTAGSRYQAQIEKAKKFFPATPEMRFVSGAIKKISGNVVTIETPQSGNPFEELPTVREVVVGDKTKIVKNEPKDPKTYQEEMAAYQNALEKAQKTLTAPAGGALTVPPAATNLPTPPQPFEEKGLKLSDLKEGMQISVEASENIKTKTRFEATRIVVIGTAGPAAAGAAPAFIPAPAPAPAPAPVSAPAPAFIPAPTLIPAPGAGQP